MPLNKVQQDQVNRHRIVTKAIRTVPSTDYSPAVWFHLWNEQVELEILMTVEELTAVGRYHPSGIFLGRSNTES